MGNKKRYSKEYLIKLYKEHGSLGKVSSFLGASYSTVRYWYKKFDIKLQESCMTVFQEIRNTPMSEEQKSIVLGSLLGDGHIKLAPHSKNARLRIAHCERQHDYLKWKYERLRPFSRKLRLDQKAKEKIINNHRFMSSNIYNFFTIAHPDITFYYKKYIRGGKKRIVSRDIIEEVDLIAMAIWFADDGSVVIDKRNGNPSCSLATNSFNYNEQLILVEVLRKFFTGTIKIDVQGNIDRNDLYIRMFRKNSIKEFLKAISTILPECIHYKLHLQRLGVEPL